MPAATSDSLSDAIGRVKTATFQGVTYTIDPANILDIADIEDEVGDLAYLDLSRRRHQLLVLWIILRKCDPTLTAEDKKSGTYHLTQQDVAQLVTAESIRKGQAEPFIKRVLELSGLMDEQPEPGNDQGNDSAPEPAKESPASDSGAKI